MAAVQHPITNGVHQMADSVSSYQPSASNELAQPDPTVDTSFEAVNQVAWAFIEQYYTTLGKNPDKLYLLYKSSSYFTCGHDGESSPCGNGITQIQERVKSLNCKNAKFRLSNIDAQPSDTSIFIQVIGDFSRTSGAAQRFVQSFVLARQTNGYYVLNDIFRSVNEVGAVVDDESSEISKPIPKEAVAVETAVETAEAEAEALPAGITETSSFQPSSERIEAAEFVPAAAAQELDQQPESASHEEAEEDAVSELPQPESAEASADEEVQSEEVEEVEEAVSEVNEEVEESVTETVAATESHAPAPERPAAPKTWASLAAQANKSATVKPVPAPSSVSAATTATVTTPTAAVVAPKSAPTVQPTSTKSVPTSATAPVTTPIAPITNVTYTAPDTESDGWVAVGNTDSKRARGTVVFGSTEARPEPEFRGYIKNVVTSVSVAELSVALAKFDVTYLDISRQKNCAFVDFGSQQALNSAIHASPYVIGEEQIFVEERRAPRGAFQPRTGVPPRHTRNGAPPSTARGGFNKETRGGGTFNGRGRGHAFRGRGAQA